MCGISSQKDRYAYRHVIAEYLISSFYLIQVGECVHLMEKEFRKHLKERKINAESIDFSVPIRSTLIHAALLYTCSLSLAISDTHFA